MKTKEQIHQEKKAINNARMGIKTNNTGLENAVQAYKKLKKANE